MVIIVFKIAVNNIRLEKRLLINQNICFAIVVLTSQNKMSRKDKIKNKELLKMITIMLKKSVKHVKNISG